MCGIAGFFDSRRAEPASALRERGEAMARTIAHRGPDDHGVWVDESSGLTLAHRRLSIIDLSPSGHQPMASASGRYVVVFNGEIYNFNEIRQEIESGGHAMQWRGHSDTEVLLAACELWGVDAALRRTNGMFAIALFDRAEQQLILARDRMGEKPLYYGWQGGVFLFGSELRSLAAHPAFAARLDPAALALFLRFGYVPAPRSVYRDIAKLPPAHLLRVPLRGGRVAASAPYWRLPEPQPDLSLQAAEAVESLDSVLRDAVRIRMHSDVPLGAFLSGGIDSSTVVAMMQAQSSRPVQSYSIGFEQRSYDESGAARTVARLLGTVHTELHVSAQDALAVVPRLPDLYDEPFADSSQIPTFLLAKLTREHVTVALSGDGGDELFGGYNRYIQGRRLLNLAKHMPRTVRHAVAVTLRQLQGAAFERAVEAVPGRIGTLLNENRLQKLADVLAADDPTTIYKRLVSQWPSPAIVAPGLEEPQTLLDDASFASRFASPIDWMAYVDQSSYLPDDILTKVDRATMAVALEARVPFLDPRVVELAARIPQQLKFHGGTGKWVVRQVLKRYLPAELFDRPKQGFAVPLAGWLRGPLRGWAEDLLSADSLQRSAVFDPQTVRRTWDDHVQGRANLQNRLWTLLMFQAWFVRASPRGT